MEVRRTVSQQSATRLYKLRPGPVKMSCRSRSHGRPHRNGRNEGNDQHEKQRAPPRLEKVNSTVCCLSCEIAVGTNLAMVAYQGWEWRGTAEIGRAS